MRAQRPFQIGKFYLSQRPNSAQWCRTWFDADTRQTRRESLGTGDLESAKVELARWVTLHADREREHPRDVPLGDVFIRYYQKHADTSAAPFPCRRNLAVILEALPPDVTVADLTLERQAEAVRKLNKRGYAPGTIKRAMGAAKAAVNFAWKNGELDRPVPFASLPEGGGRERVLTIDEMAALWDAEMPEHVRVFLALLIGTAARPEAALQLTAFQCDLDRGFLNLNPPGRQQTKKRRPILPIADFLRPWIETADAGPLVSWRGQACSEDQQDMAHGSGSARAWTPKSCLTSSATPSRRRCVPGAYLS